MDPTVDMRLTFKPDKTADPEEIKTLLTAAVPGVNVHDLKQQTLTGGNLNSVTKVWHEDDPEGDVVVVRVFTDVTQHVSDTSGQAACMRAAHRGGCGAEVVASFTNGIVYRFTPGELLSPLVYDDPVIRRKVGVELAKFHHIKAECPQEIRVFKEVEKAMKDLPDILGTEELYLNDYFTSKSVLYDEYIWLKKLVEKENFPLVFSHSDLWWGNIIYNKQADTVHFIDFDGAGHNILPYDIARFFDSAKVVPHMQPPFVETLDPEEERDIIRAYLQSSKQLESNNSLVTEEDVEKLYGHCVLLKPYLNLQIIIYILNIHAKTPQPPLMNHLRNLTAPKYARAKKEYLRYVSTEGKSL